MGNSPAIYGGSRTKILTSKGLLLKDGTPIDYNGQKNYITKGTFATNATTGWNLKRTTLSGLIPNQVAASWTTPSVLTLSATSTGALTQAGFSLSLAASGVTTAGDMLVSDPYTIDIEDQAKTLAFKFSYKAYTNPTNLVFAGNSTNTFHVYIYDDANSAWIQPTGCYSTVQSSGVGIATGTFQTPSNMTSFRIAIVSCNASLNTTGGGAFTMYFDNFSVGPQITNMGVPVTDWVSYTPTWTATTTDPAIGNGSITGKWARVGDSGYYQIKIVTGTTTTYGSGVYRFSLPSGHNLDYAKQTFSGASDDAIVPGDAVLLQSSVNRWQFRTANLGGFSASQFALVVQEQSTAATEIFSNTNFGQGAPRTLSGSGNQITINIGPIPISGWSSNTVMSSDAAVNVVAARAYRASSQGGIAPNGGYHKISIDTVQLDTNAAFDVVNYRYNVKIPGWYSYKALVYINGANVLTSQYFAAIYKNGSPISFGQSAYAQVGSPLSLLVADTQYLTPNDYLEVYIYGAGNNSVNQLSCPGGSNNTFFSIERISGPAQIAAASVVAARITKNGTQTVGSGETKITGMTVVKDSNSMWDSSNNRWNIPISGDYRLTMTQSYSAFSGTQLLGYRVNGSAGSDWLSPAIAVDRLNGSALIVNLKAGDYIEMYNYSGTSATINTGSGNSYYTLERLGGVM